MSSNFPYQVPVWTQLRSDGKIKTHYDTYLIFYSSLGSVKFVLLFRYVRYLIAK